MLDEFLQNHGKRIGRNAIGFFVISIAAQPLDGDHLRGRPAEEVIPLVAVLDGAGLQATRPLNEQEPGRHARDLPPGLAMQTQSVESVIAESAVGFLMLEFSVR